MDDATAAERHSVEDGKYGYTPDFTTVLESEKRYLADRRDANDLPGLDDDPKLWGLALSGGGVRSATFCLGALQALAGNDRMPRFDYLSTVSGGGYIGSCLTSLLTSQTNTGLDNDHFPFTGLGEPEDCADSTEPKLSVRHQIHHLRTHGEYLIPRSHLLSRDVQRAVGSFVSGTVHTVVIFVLLFIGFVAAVHLTLTALDPDLAVLAPPIMDTPATPETEGAWEYLKTALSHWYGDRIVPPFREAFSQAGQYLELLLVMAGLSFLWSLTWFIRATRLANEFHPEDHPPDNGTLSGWTPGDQIEADFVRTFNTWSVLLTILLTLGVSLFYRLAGPAAGEEHFLTGLFIPFAISAGGFVTGQFLMHFYQAWMKRRVWRRREGQPQSEDAGEGFRTDGRKRGQRRKPPGENRLRRSLYGSLRGACVFGSVTSVVVPILLVLLFSLKAIPVKVFFVLLSLAWAQLLSRKGGGAALPQLGGWLRRPLANSAVLVFLAFAFAWVSSWLQSLYPSIASGTWLGILIVGGIATALFIFLGVFINANRIAPHYFYRDRLTEAYLKTDARTLRKEPPGKRSQGMPLTTLRDDENLKLSELGGATKRTPYHLIVAALNLSGSKELNRKSFLSEHFVFSRDYIGSKVTGWVKTGLYRGGTTRLARAMAVSAASVGSAMGLHTFAAQAFLTTFFNARLGYWMENPWTYRHLAAEPDHRIPGGSRMGMGWDAGGRAEKEPKGRRGNAKKKGGAGVTFWPRYLMLEVLGRASARTPRVNISDGGHTGDNLGLLPLLRRRCSTILVCDAEADGGYTFGSFNNAVRMALTEENIDIDIDLTPILTRSETPAGYVTSDESVVVGRIHYPNDERDNPVEPGKLVYIKSSVSGDNVPVHVENYAKEHAAFPHQTTADQFFDDAQFEAYRALGAYLGAKGAAALG
jgi:hypothetical protein